MRTHTNDFKTEIAPLGRQIKGKIYHYFNYEIDTEASDKIITENDSYLILEGYNKDDKEELTDENIYSMKLIKNGELLQSLMKQFNFEAKYGLRIGDVINPHFGLLVNGEYEFLDYGDYIIYSKQYNANNETWDYVCYDLMLYSMIQYNGLNISYPITVKNYINAIANKMGVGFANINDAFTNSEELIYKDLFKGKNKTYRDILDKLSEITASNILINDDNELEVYYPKYVGEITDVSNSSIEIANSEETELQAFELEGKTTQETRSGKNLCKPIATATKQNMTFTNNGDGSYTLNGTAQANTSFYITGLNYPAGTYTFCANNPTTNSNGAFYFQVEPSASDRRKTFTEINAKMTFTINTAITAWVVVVPSGLQLNNFVIRPQLEAGNQATEFEPYGVQPSPDYPSELVSVGYENLFNIPNGTKTSSDLTATIQDGIVSVSGTSTATSFLMLVQNTFSLKAGTYTISAFNPSTYNDNQFDLRITGKNGVGILGRTYLNVANSSTTFTLSEDLEEGCIQIRASSGDTFTNFIVKPQLTVGSQSHSYIPYGKYGIEVKTTGKNLFDNVFRQGNVNGNTSVATQIFDDSNYFVIKNTNYIISTNIDTATYKYQIFINDKPLPKLNTDPEEYTSGWKTTATFSFNINVNGYLGIGIVRVDGGNLTPNDIQNVLFQLEKGTTATDYEEYKSNTYLYTLDNPLRSIGNTKDLLYIKDGYLYVERKIGSIVLNGTEGNWYQNRPSSYPSGTYRFANTFLSNLLIKPTNNDEKAQILCDYFNTVSADDTVSKINGITVNISGTLYIYYDYLETSSIDDFKNWLSTHNAEVQYILAEPYIEELGQVETPETYEGTTYIETTDGNEPTMNISYISEFEEIDEEYLKDVNVNFGEKFGQINRVAIRDTENKIEYVAQDNISIEKNKLTQINIIDNPITLNGNEDNICQNILNKLNGLYYSINDFTTTGLCYYDFLDIFFVKIKDTRYQCLLLNNEITITQGIEETIFADAKSNSQVEGSNYETNYLTNKDIQTKITQLNDTKVENKSVINSINDSKERAVISTEKIMYIKDFTGTTDANGFLDIELNADFVVCSATASFNSNDYGFVIPYYDYNSGSPKWELKIKDKNDVAVANTQIATTIYYFKKERND